MRQTIKNNTLYLKKFILVILLINLVSCIEKPKITPYEVTLEIHYPSRIDTIVVKGTCTVTPKLKSYRGSNFIIGYPEAIYQTTAPIKVISIKKIGDYEY